jgi:hypothetical protein
MKDYNSVYFKMIQERKKREKFQKSIRELAYFPPPKLPFFSGEKLVLFVVNTTVGRKHNEERGL